MGEGGQRPPIDGSYSGGRRLRGLSIDLKGKAPQGVGTEAPRSKRPDEPALLDSASLTKMALELGFAWDTFATSSDGTFEVIARQPTDAEALYLQVPNPITLAFYTQAFGGGLPALFWSDLGAVMPKVPHQMTEEERRRVANAFYVGLCLIQSQGAADSILGEGVRLVLICATYDRGTYEITLGPGQVGAIFRDVPRAVVLRPQCEFDPMRGHKVITGFGSEEIHYWQSAYLRGAASQQMWGIEEVARRVGEKYRRQ